jgi:hypothetical protein
LGALLTSLLLVYLRRRSRAVLAATVLASVGYAGMLAGFFLLNRPVNAAVALWTATTMPPGWMAYRARWEAGHAIAAALALASLALLICAYVRERRPARA